MIKCKAVRLLQTEPFQSSIIIQYPFNKKLHALKTVQERKKNERTLCALRYDEHTLSHTYSFTKTKWYTEDHKIRIQRAGTLPFPH